MAGKDKAQPLRKPNIFEQRRQMIDAASGWGAPAPATNLPAAKKKAAKKKAPGGY